MSTREGRSAATINQAASKIGQLRRQLEPLLIVLDAVEHLDSLGKNIEASEGRYRQLQSNLDQVTEDLASKKRELESTLTHITNAYEGLEADKERSMEEEARRLAEAEKFAKDVIDAALKEASDARGAAERERVEHNIRMRDWRREEEKIQSILAALREEMRTLKERLNS